jgi:hypothetical protein
MTSETELLRTRVASEFGLTLSEVTDALLVKLAEDPTFAYHLALCGSDPDMQRIVLLEVTGRRSDSRVSVADAAVVARAGAAMARWAASGFGRVSQAEHRRRLAICGACEHLTEPPDSVLYALVSGRGKTVCGLCGCDVRKKAWLSTEQCPDRRHGLGGRW